MKQFNHILYVTEASAEEVPAMVRAASLAENNQANLTVVDVVPVVSAGIGMPPGGPISSELQSAMVNQRRTKLKSLIAPYQQDRNIQIEVFIGEMYLEVIRAVLRSNYDLVIKPATNPDFIERLFGSNDMQLLRMCPCPVWLMGPGEKSNYERILAAVDFNLDDTPNDEDAGLNQQILELASSLALSDFAELHFVHVWDAPYEVLFVSWADNPDETRMRYVRSEIARHQEALDRLRAQVRGQIGQKAFDHLSPQFHLRRGAASTVIPEIAKQLQADLVVMGTVARTGMAGLFVGNTAEDVLEQLQCSVMAVKPHGFVSPVKQAE